jgi:hypothetical protein
MLSCSEDVATGHLHEEDNLYAQANNVHWDPALPCTCEDLRSNIFNPPQQSSLPNVQGPSTTTTQADEHGSGHEPTEGKIVFWGSELGLG